MIEKIALGCIIILGFGCIAFLAIGYLILWMFSDHESLGIIYNLKSQLIDSTGVYKVLIRL